MKNIFPKIIGMEFDKWRELHKHCQLKRIESGDSDRAIIALQCLDHNHVYIFDEVSGQYDYGSKFPDHYWTALRFPAFKRLVDEAKKFDELTKQPPCEDPTKEELLRRIEERLARIEEKLGAAPSALGEGAGEGRGRGGEIK